MAGKPREKVKYYDNPVKLGRRLRETREASGLSQRELSFPGCTAAYISRVEKGERVPSLQLIREFATRLKVSDEWLCYGGNKRRPAATKLTPFEKNLLRSFGGISEVELRMLKSMLRAVRANTGQRR